MLYEVTSPGGRKIIVEAKNSTQAKRLACRRWGIKANDSWSGVTSMQAKLIKEHINQLPPDQ